MGFIWVEPKRGGRIGGRGPSPYQIRLTIRASGKNEQRKPQIGITLSEKLMKEMRWQAGDRVAVGINESAIGLRRVSDGGYALTPIATSKKSRHSLMGKSTSSIVKFTLPEAWPLRDGDILEMTDMPKTDDGVILVPFAYMRRNIK